MPDQIARGYKTQCLLDFEESFGVAPSTPAGVILPINSFGVNVSRNKNSAETLTGRRDPVEPFDGDTEVSGDIVVPVDCRAFPYWLKLLLGAPVTTGDSAPYTHVFKVSDTTPSGILQCKFGTDPLSYGLFKGAKVSSMSMSVGGDGELTATFSIAGREATYSNTDYDANATAVVLKRLNNFKAKLKKDGADFAKVTQFDINIDNGLDTSIRTIGGEGMVYDIPEGIMNVSGSMTTLFTGLDLITAAENSTEMSLELKIDVDENNSMTILLPEVQSQYQGPQVEGATGITVEAPFVGYYNNDVTNNSCVVITVKNDVSSYA